MWIALAWSIAGAFLSVVGTLAGRVLVALGIGFATYKGADVALSALMMQVKSAFAGVPGEISQFLAFMWVDKALSVLFSAYVAALGLKTAAGAALKMVAKK